MKSLLAFWIAMLVTLGVAMPSHADPQPADTTTSATQPAAMAAAPAKSATVAAPVAPPPSQKAISTFRPPKKQKDQVRIEANQALKEISDLKKAGKDPGEKDNELVKFLKAREKETPNRDALYQDLKFRDELWAMLKTREQRIKEESELAAHRTAPRHLPAVYTAPQESVVATPDRATEAALAKCNEQCRAKIAEANQRIRELNDELNRAKEDVANRKTPSSYDRDRDDRDSDDSRDRDSNGRSTRRSRNSRMTGTSPQSILAELFSNGNGMGNNMFNPMGQQQGWPGQNQQPMWPGQQQQQQQPFGMGNRFLPNMYSAQQQGMNPWARNNMNMPQQPWPQQGGQFAGAPFMGGQFGGGAQWGGQRPAPGMLPMGQQQQFGLGTQFGIGSGFGSTIYNGGQNGGYNYAGNLNQFRSLPNVYAAPRPY